MTLYGFPHTYEVAWENTAAGPVLTDLRVRASDGAPIARDDMRVNVDTLVKAAQRYDTTEEAAAARELRESFDAAIGNISVDTRGIEALRFTDGTVDALIKHAPEGAKLPTPQPRKGGRPKTITHEFLAQVADWAREARDRKAAVYPYVAARAADALGRNGVANETVKSWLQQCRNTDPPLLRVDELRKPRTSRADN
ncbi:hypothetical protein ACXPWS_12875 [Mycobacterium sp. BMJ-28]